MNDRESIIAARNDRILGEPRRNASALRSANRAVGGPGLLDVAACALLGVLAVLVLCAAGGG